MASEQTIPRQSIVPKIGVMMKQPTFDQGSDDKYSKLKKLQIRGN